MHLYCIINYMQNFLVYFFYDDIDWIGNMKANLILLLQFWAPMQHCHASCSAGTSNQQRCPQHMITLIHALFCHICYLCGRIILCSWLFFIIWLHGTKTNRGLRSEFGSVFPSCMTNSILICVPFILFNTLQDQSTAQMPNSQCSTCSVSQEMRSSLVSG